MLLTQVRPVFGSYRPIAFAHNQSKQRIQAVQIHTSAENAVKNNGIHHPARQYAGFCQTNGKVQVRFPVERGLTERTIVGKPIYIGKEYIGVI
jgi:hypothetical protein